MKTLARVLSWVSLVFLPSTAQSLLLCLAEAYQQYLEHRDELFSPLLTQALLIAEDRRFYRHGGVDVLATLRATWISVFGRQLVGGSTVEQQLVRTISGERARTLRRKFREILLCTLVRRVVPKRDVPGLYLSLAYFGWRMNGLKEACARLRFTPTTLTPRQAAAIVARLKYPEPEHWSQTKQRLIASRSQYILTRLAEGNAISRLEVEATENETVFDF